MTRSLGLLIPLLLAPTGCIIYSNEGVQTVDPDAWWDDEVEDRPDTGDTSGLSFGWSVYPPSAAPGETLLVTLDVDDGRDLLAVTEVDFGANIQIHDQWFDEEEILVVIEVAEDAPGGPQEIHITMADGTELTIDAAFVVEAPAPADGADTGSGCE